MKTVPVQDPQQLFDVNVVAGILFVSVATIRRFVKQGQLECVRVGDLQRFTRQQIDTSNAIPGASGVRHERQ